MGIIRQLFIVLIGVAIVVAHSKPTWSQLGHDVAHWLDRDTTVLLNIRDVRTTYDRIRELDLFSNPRFEKAIQLVSDERFPIIKADDLDEVFQKLRDLETLVRDLKQISIVIHQFDENQFT